MDKLHYDRADYSVVVKNSAPPPKAWRWEIYRAGNANPIKQSSIYFDTTASARRAGKDALTELLNKLFSRSRSGAAQPLETPMLAQPSNLFSSSPRAPASSFFTA